ncbi:MAG TPA: sialidase family protein, partial [Gemmatimonadales bacterium]|nr:sialidase family protein [Gemmatimonadales bacterium]
NSFSYSDDGGRTFRPARQSLHGDDRILWVNPRDSRHVIKGDDGGVGISYDRAVTWLYWTHLPVSQYYRVRVDNQTPYHVYGGLQDNGTWIGPSATYLSAGVRFEDWFHVNGGDGFLAWPDTVDGRTVYTESQYLGLTRFDLITRLSKPIRPGDPRGAIGERRNFEAWFTGTPEPELLNAMAPANWDGPYILSAFDNNTLYAGTNKLWKSTDRGETWQDLGNLTTNVNRRELRIMGRCGEDSTASLDDGAPYYPTISAVAESPLQRGLLYVGTDDGNLQVSRDDGRTWTNVIARVPGLPRSVWISAIEPSRHDAGTVYLAINNYRNNDFANYLFKSTDFGQTWTSLVGDLPPRRVLRMVREDLRNPRVLYLGAELGLFYSNDGGAHWVELKGDMPTMPFNDLVIHRRDNDLVLATHARGIMILDNINALQELTPEVLLADAHLFTLEPASQVRYADETAHVGDMVFRGENPPEGAIIDYYLREAGDSASVRVTIHDAAGQEINRVRPRTSAGLNRVVWSLRHADILPPRAAGPGPGGFGGGGGRVQGPWVVPGAYTVRLTAGSTVREQRLDVRNDPRINVSTDALKAWHDTLVSLGQTIRAFAPRADAAEALRGRLDSLPAAQRGRTAAQMRELSEVVTLARELRSRLTGLYNEVAGWVGPLSADQRSRLAYYREFLARLEPRMASVMR